MIDRPRSPGAEPLHVNRISQVFSSLPAIGEGDRVTLGAMLTTLGDRAFGLLVLVFALPNIIPMIPGVSTISGVVIALVGLQMLVGRHEPWLPASIAARGLPKADLEAMIARTLPWVRRLEAAAHPRLPFMTEGAMRLFLGLVFVILGAVLALPLSWIGNFPPGVALVVLSVGLVERDGLLVLAGHVIGLFAVALVALVLVGLFAGAAWLMG